MNPATKISGLYALTPDWIDTAKLIQATSQALAGGVGVLQYRHKHADAALQRVQARELLALCQNFDARLIINDNLDLAEEIGADGVHIGAEDVPLPEARCRLGQNKIIGVSCYNQIHLAQAAQTHGADYVAFGSFFASPTKPHAVTAPLSILSEARHTLRLPLVAIGGITLANAGSLAQAGADAVAVISALFESTDIQATAAAFSRLFEQTHQPTVMA